MFAHGNTEYDTLFPPLGISNWLSCIARPVGIIIIYQEASVTTIMTHTQKKKDNKSVTIKDFKIISYSTFDGWFVLSVCTQFPFVINEEVEWHSLSCHFTLNVGIGKMCWKGQFSCRSYNFRACCTPQQSCLVAVDTKYVDFLRLPTINTIHQPDLYCQV